MARTRRTSRVGVVVEPPGQLHPQPARRDPLEGLGHELVVASAQLGHDLGGQGRPQRLAEVALDLLAPAEVLAVEQVVGHRLLGGALDRLGRGVGDEQGAGGVEHAAVRELEGGLGPADERGVERRHGALDLGVQPVEAGGRVGQVPRDADDEDDEERRQLQDVDHQLPPPGTPRTSAPQQALRRRLAGSASAPAMTVS